ncbi:MAG: EutN/CcmL family microcompartment protein [Anaerolineaceae bacterium]|nr:EutN/CcmL family microcompartment protein [Anaerolineaceae bacterium]
MFIGEVVGTVVATRKTANMDGLPLRLVRKITPGLESTSAYTVVVDIMGASEGELVLVSSGSSARQTIQTDARPCDAIIMAIVDTWQVDGAVQYTKGELAVE